MIKSIYKKLQEKNSDCKGAFCGYGVAVKDFKNPIIDFDRNNTYIRVKELIKILESMIRLMTC